MPELELHRTAIDLARVILAAGPMPLTRGRKLTEVLRTLDSSPARELFPEAFSPEGALAGLFIAAGGWDAAHGIAQNLNTPEGIFWHAIVHRQEPDSWNSKYWFRQIGPHPIFPKLAEEAIGIDRANGSALAISTSWDAERFVDLCESAAGTATEHAVREIQQAEWKLLFDWCVRGALD